MVKSKTAGSKTPANRVEPKKKDDKKGDKKKHPPQTTKQDDIDRKKEQLTEWQSMSATVETLKEMTETEQWIKLHKRMQQKIKIATTSLRTCEKNRDIIKLQMTCLVIQELINEIQAPVETINAFVVTTPLFASDARYTYSWDKKVGCVRRKDKSA